MNKKSIIYGIVFCLFVLFDSSVFAGSCYPVYGLCGYHKAGGKTYPAYRHPAPNNSCVAVWEHLTDMSKDEKKVFDEEIKKNFPNAQFISGSTVKYNCHSYAWYSQSTKNKYWMDDPYWYINDGSHSRNTNSTPDRGDKVHYYKGDHSAVGYSGRTVKSKWGAGPLMKHKVNYGPPIYKMAYYRFYMEN